MLTYVLVTPARNEAEFIDSTIRCVIAQTRRPACWVIVSDGSTDATDAIVQSHAAAQPWIRLVRREPATDRNFSSKVLAFNAGYAALSSVPYDVIGSLDADISFDEGYFEFLLERFAADPRLGVGGTPFREGECQYDFRFTNIEHVSGACQLFRRACFEEIGGYRPINGGGIDWVAVTTARMNGWHTRTFCEKTCQHHRPMGTAQHTVLAQRFRLGEKDYALGGHPLWQLFRGGYHMAKNPLLLGGALLIAGYTCAWVMRRDRVVGSELQAFHQREQLSRLRALLGRARRAGGRLLPF